MTCGRSEINSGTPVSSTNKTDWNIVVSGDKHHNPNPFIEELLSCIMARMIYIEWKYDDVALFQGLILIVK